MIKLVQSIFLLLLIPALAVAQKTLTGTIYANSMQQPLAGVSIAVKGGVGATISDKDGNFTLQSYIKSPTLIFNYKGLAVQERTCRKKKITEIMTVNQKYLGT